MGDLLCCLVREHDTIWDQTLSTVEFANNNFVNRSTIHNPFETITHMLPKRPIDLVSLSLEARQSARADAFSKHIQDAHDDAR